MEEGLAQLLEAHDYAHELQHDIWQFAVELRCLERAGLSSNSLRWLLGRGYVEHALEEFLPRGRRRCFRPPGSLAFPVNTCVVLTAAGVVLARSLASSGQDLPLAAPPPAGNLRPFWDGDLRELRCGDLVIKRLGRRATRQEPILATFQEDGWPHRIDDPLPGEDGVVRWQRLHDAINHLNRAHRYAILRFRHDGSGEGICWYWLPGAAQERHWSGTGAALDRRRES
jgi:hypothetical protein